MTKGRKSSHDSNQLRLGLDDAAAVTASVSSAPQHPSPPAPRDQTARFRIRRELTRSMLVEAGAGSGKTHEMATRMAAGVAEGVYAVEHMAAVTFTRKAAAELRGRFQLALEADLMAADGDRAIRLRSALANLERFFAGTIHSFCARLLRERPVEAGVSPGFTELDDAEEMMLRRQSWRDYRAQAKAAGQADLLALLDAGVDARHFERAFHTICDYEDVEFPPGDATMPDGEAAWKALGEFWDAMQSLLPEKIASDSKCATQGRCDRFARSFNFASRHAPDTADVADLLEIWQAKPNVTQKWWPTKRAALDAEALHSAFRAAVVIPFLQRWRPYVYRLAVSLLVRAREAARAERLRRNSLSFNDLLLITAKMLRENPDVRRSLQQKYRWLFVDEFQDTDPIQAEIMFLLAGAEGPAPGRSLFVVGDPKQSIYRFRRADIDIYSDVRARLAGEDGSGIVRLTTNFRSVPGLCAWANSVFEQRFPTDPTPHAPAFAPLEPYREAGTGSQTEPHRARLVIPEGADEGAMIARYIRAEVDAGRRKYSDFLVLTRKRKPLRSLARALEAMRVPIEVTGAGAFGESEEVRHLALLLAALADPQDAVTLVGVLRGPLFGLSDRELFAYREAGGHFNLFASAGTATRVENALSTLRRWHKWVSMLPPGAALERVLEDSGMLALAAASPDGVEAGDLLHAVDRVRAIVESGFTLADAADTLEAWVENDGELRESSEVDSLPLEPGRPDVVRVMNLHKAKGLEARVVFLADPAGGFRPRPDIRIVREEGAALGYLQICKDALHGGQGKVLAEPAGWTELAEEEKAYLDAEVDRLLYVAATRARDLLVVSRPQGKSRGTPAWDEFDAFLSQAPALSVPATVALPPPASVDLSDAALERATSAAARAHNKSRTPSWAAVSVTSEAKLLDRAERLAELSARADASYAEAGEKADASADPTRTILPTTASHRADAGIAWGTLVHGLLEHAMRHKSATRDDLRRLALWLTMEEPALRQVIDLALDTVQAVAGAAFWKDARASDECHEEVPFSLREDRAGVPTVVGGTIDLVYRATTGAWRILDYKTDTDVTAEELRARYAMQLEMYRQAWARFGGRSSSEIAPARMPAE